MKTWILVADSARARIFEIGAQDGQLFEVGGYANPEAHTKPSDTGYDKPPRAQESVGGARHAIEPHTDPHDKPAEKFAHGLAEILEHGRVEHAYTRLLLVAPPRFLGMLRGELSPRVQKTVVGEIHHDYVHTPLHQVGALIAAQLQKA